MATNSKKMEKNTKLKILNILSGADDGGAERFFERLTISFDKKRIINQKVLIKTNSRRLNLLKKNINDLDQVSIFNPFNPFCYKKINDIVSEFEPNVILAWMNRASKLLPKIRINNEIKVGRLGGFYKIKNYVKCDYLIANTVEIKKYLINHGWDPLKVEYIPNFVNKNNNEKIDISLDHKKIIVCLGRFHKNKAFDVMIKAMTFLPSFKLWIIGSGKLKDSYLESINKLNLLERVALYDWTDNISQYLNVADLLVCPSRHEPFGNVVVDAWSHKIPVVVSNTGGPGNLIKHRINGLKFESENSFELAEQIQTVMDDANLRKKILKNGYLEFKNNFSEDVIVNKYIDFFRKISK